MQLFSCQQDVNNEQEQSQAPGIPEQEYLMTRNPETGEVEREKLWDYLLSNKSFLGRKSFDKTVVYPATWEPVDDYFASLAVQRLVYDPNNTTTMYFCTGEGWNNADAARGAGVWKTEDGGDSWVQLTSTLTDTFWYCHDMLVHPVTSDVYVATRVAGLMRSKDGGNTWEKVLGEDLGSLSNRTTDIELTADNEMVVCLGNFDTDGIYFSTTGDAGSWEKRMNGMTPTNRRIELATAPSNANVMYAIPTSSISSDSNKIHGVFRSDDKGLNWRRLSLPGGDRNLAKKQGWYDLIVQVAPDDEDFLLVGGLNVYRSTDGGENWQLLFEGDRRKKSDLQYVHVDQHEIYFKTADTVLFGNDGGIYKCDDIKADTPFFENLNANYNVTQFYACDIARQKGNSFVIGGTQDNGSLGSQGEGVSEFRQLSWADGSYCNIDHEDPDIFYTTTQYRRLYRNNHGVIDTLTNENIVNNNTLFINPIEMDPNDPNILYQLTNRGLWRLTNARTATAEDWEKASRNFGTFSAIGIATDKPNTVFIGRSSGGPIYRIDNANTTDDTYLPINLDRSSTLPDAYCRSIYVNPKDANHLIAVYSNYGVESVWESKDALSDNPTWSSHEGNLPDIPIRWAELHPENTEVCYLGTEAGVMMTTKLDGANTNWKLINDGFANLKVNMLRIRPNDLTMVVASHGRGIFTGKIQDDYSVVWEERGPQNVGGRTRTMLFDPNDPTGKRLWAGSVSGGLWKIENWDSISVNYTIYDEFSVKVGPVPTNDGRLTVFVSAETEKNVDYKLFNLSGALIMEGVLPVMPGSNEFELKIIDGNAAGIYLLRFETHGFKQVNKVVTY